MFHGSWDKKKSAKRRLLQIPGERFPTAEASASYSPRGWRSLGTRHAAALGESPMLMTVELMHLVLDVVYRHNSDPKNKSSRQLFDFCSITQKKPPPRTQRVFVNNNRPKSANSSFLNVVFEYRDILQTNEMNSALM